jgi:hypothetical protein
MYEFNFPPCDIIWLLFDSDGRNQNKIYTEYEDRSNSCVLNMRSSNTKCYPNINHNNNTGT